MKITFEVDIMNIDESRALMSLIDQFCLTYKSVKSEEKTV